MPSCRISVDRSPSPSISATAVCSFASSSSSTSCAAPETMPLLPVTGNTAARVRTACSTPVALANAVSVLCGASVLAMPFALRQAGWLGGLGVMVVYAALCNFTANVLGELLDRYPRLLTYTDIGRLAFGWIGAASLAVLFFFDIFIMLIAFLLIIGDHLHHLVPAVSPQLHLALAALLLLPFCFLRHFDELALLSFASSFGSFCLPLVLLTNFASEMAVVDASKLFDLKGMAVAIGLIASCYGGHPMLPPIYVEMEHKSQYKAMATGCFSLVTFDFITMAALGYMSYGERARAEITLNLPHQELSTRCIFLLVLLITLTKFPVCCHTVALVLEDALEDATSHRDPRALRQGVSALSSIAIRTLLVASAAAVAVGIPHFAVVVGFGGSAVSVALSLVAPCAAYCRLEGLSVATLPHLLTLCVGCGAAVAGLWGSLQLLHGDV